jgi:hypothetical protein
MSLLLPDFKGRKCRIYSFCAQFVHEGGLTIPPVGSSKKSLIARNDQVEPPVFVSLVQPFPGDKETKKQVHVHLRYAVADLFGDDPPKTNLSVEELLKVLEPFLGQKADVRLEAIYEVAQVDLPPLLRSTMTIADNVQVRMTAGTLSVRGAPINKISWEIQKGGSAEVILKARAELTIDEAGVLAGLDLVESAFRAFIVPETANAEENP